MASKSGTQIALVELFYYYSLSISVVFSRLLPLPDTLLLVVRPVFLLRLRLDLSFGRPSPVVVLVPAAVAPPQPVDQVPEVVEHGAEQGAPAQEHVPVTYRSKGRFKNLPHSVICIWEGREREEIVV